MQKKESRTSKNKNIKWIFECHFGKPVKGDNPEEYLSDTQLALLSNRLGRIRNKIMLLNNRTFSVQLLEYSELCGMIVATQGLPVRNILINRQILNRKIKITGGHVELSTGGGFMAGGYIPHVEVIEKEE